MIEFEQALEDCLLDLEEGASSVDECLARHPEHAAQLGAPLITAVRLMRGREVQAPPAFTARLRTQVKQQMTVQARRRSSFNLPIVRFAMGFAVVLLALLVTATAYAQRALPGQALYGWKLATEKTWRAVSPDPVGADLAILKRRVEELVALGNDSARGSEALEGYYEVTDRLKSEIDPQNEARILPALDSHLEELVDSGIIAPVLQTETPLPAVEPIPTLTPTPMPTTTPTARPSSTPQTEPGPSEPVDLPPIISTDVPEIIRTDVPNIIQTVLPNLIPTIDLPLLGR
jgi:hypothetical protein